MTEQELTIIYNKNIMQMQEILIKNLTKANSFLGLPSFKQRELNRESISCYKQSIKVLKRNYKKDLKSCEIEPVDNLMTADKVEELVNQKVEQSDF